MTAGEGIKRRHTKRQRARIRAMKRRRFIFFSSLILITILILMFFTPIFNIRKVVVTGNESVTIEEINLTVGQIEGDNLFRTRTGRIRKNLLAYPYIKSATVKRIAFPPSVKVSVVECEPAGYMIENQKYIVIDETAKVLEVSEDLPENIPQLVGVSPVSFEPGDTLEIDEANKFDVMLLCISEMRKAAILNGVRLISFEDISNIVFNYEDRLDALCGSAVEIPKKMSMFRAAIQSSVLTENSRGTIDLSVAGKAEYTP